MRSVVPERERRDGTRGLGHQIPPPTTSASSMRCLGPPRPSRTPALGLSILQAIELLGLRGEAPLLPDETVTAISEEDINTIRETLAGMTPTDQSTMAIAWGTLSSVIMIEVNREIVETLHVKPAETDDDALMQTSMSGGGRGGDRRRPPQDGDRFPERPTKKFRRTSRRRSLGTRRRTMEEELAELRTNIGKGGRSVSRACRETAQKLRHVIGRRSDDHPVGRAGLEKEESDHLLALMTRRGDRGALIIAAASFQMLAQLALDMATAVNLHIVHQEHAARDRAMDGNNTADDDPEDETQRGDNAALVQLH